MLSMQSGAQRASRRSPLRRTLVATMLLVLVGAGAVVAGPPAAAAVDGPKVAIIVGPAGTQTAGNRVWADAAAQEARHYTQNVVRVYSPRATWSSVKAAITGASIVVYIGRGYGFPTPRTRTLNKSVHDGFGLNPVSGVDNSTTRYYGETYIRQVRFAPGALVLLSHLSYASGNGESGQPQPTLTVARQRVDNYAAGFLAAGATAVIAEAAYSPTWYIRAIFTRNTSIDSVWRTAPSYHGHVTSVWSSRTHGAVSRTDPTQKGSGYYRAFTGRPSLTTATIRGGIPVSAVPVPPPSTVPASINATCASNVSAALNAWIKSRPDGSTLTFPSGSCYRLGSDAGLNLANRTGLTLIGTGVTLQQRTTGASNFSSAFFLQNSKHITIRGFAVDGGNAATGTTGAAAAINEHINGAVIRAGCSFVEFDHVNWNRLRGFGILISAEGGTTWPADISIHDSVIRGGEMGIGILAGRRIKIERNAINDSVYIAVDLEPDTANQGFADVLISDNDVTRYSWGQNLTSWFVAANPTDSILGSTLMDGLTITGNRVHVGAATTNNGNADGLGGLGIRADKANRKYDVVITNNTTSDDDTQSSGRGVIYLANVQNLTVTGNRQPISGGATFVRDSGTTGTRTVSGNNTSKP